MYIIFVESGLQENKPWGNCTPKQTEKSYLSYILITTHEEFCWENKIWIQHEVVLFATGMKKRLLL